MPEPNPYESARVSSACQAGNTRMLHCGWGIRCIAAIHMLAAGAIGALIFISWNPGDLYEALPWMLLVAAFVSIAIGLWRRRLWTRPVALVIHGAMAVLALVVGIASAILLLVVPGKGGIEVLHGFAIVGICASMIVGPLTGIIFWYMHASVSSDTVPLGSDRLAE